MPQILPIPTIISLAKICEYLSSYKVNIDNAFSGGSLDAETPIKIYRVRKSLEWMYDNNSSDENIVLVGDYLYALCGKFITEAKAILGSTGGMVVVPSTSTNIYAFNQLQLVADGSSGNPTANTNNYQNNILIGATDLYQLSINRQIFYENTDYTFSPITGMITFVSYVWNSGDTAVITFNQKVN